MKKQRLRIIGIFGLFMLILWFIFTEWHFIPYTKKGYSNGEVRVCYSPNHEFYIKEYRTLFQSLFHINFSRSPPTTHGIAILYDKTGKELHRGHARFDYGPSWVTHYDDTGTFSRVYYECSAGEEEKFGWDAELPSSPQVYGLYSPDKPRPDGRIDTDGGCFAEIDYYLFPDRGIHDGKRLIIKAVEPSEKTKAPYQLQFLIQNHEGHPPFIALHYMIIRADGSRKQGETDEKGRTFVVESSHEESITFYFSPYQGLGGFMLPEELEEWCARSPDACSRLEDHIFTANTIKIEPGK